MANDDRGDVRFPGDVHHFEDSVQMADGMPDGEGPLEILPLHVND
jgi:hypothetical protein